jgi:hypothetical protein
MSVKPAAAWPDHPPYFYEGGFRLVRKLNRVGAEHRVGRRRRQAARRKVPDPELGVAVASPLRLLTSLPDRFWGGIRSL